MSRIGATSAWRPSHSCEHRRSRGSVTPASREADGAKRSGLTGPWTAGYIRMRALSDPDVFLPGDVGVVRALQQLDFGGRVRIVRINALDTPYTYRDLVDVVEAAGDHLDLVMLPKAESPVDVVFVDTLLSQIEATRGLGTRIGIEAQIETARGFLYAREIAGGSSRLDALIFGPGDVSQAAHTVGFSEHLPDLLVH